MAAIFISAIPVGATVAWKRYGCSHEGYVERVEQAVDAFESSHRGMPLRDAGTPFLVVRDEHWRVHRVLASELICVAADGISWSRFFKAAS